MRKLIISLILALLAISANASTGEGGGDALVCFTGTQYKAQVEAKLRKNKKIKSAEDPLAGVQDKIKSVELLDLFYLRKDITSEVIKAGGKSYQQIINERLNILNRETNFSIALQTDSRFIGSNHGVLELDDSNHVTIFPSNCLLVQLAYRKDLSKYKYAVYYEERLFSMLSEIDKAALFFHEWTFAKDDMFADSSAAREFVQLIFSKKLEALSGSKIAWFFESLDIGNNKLDYVSERKALGETVSFWKINRKAFNPSTRSYWVYINLNGEKVKLSGEFCKSATCPTLTLESESGGFNIDGIEYNKAKISSGHSNLESLESDFTAEAESVKWPEHGLVLKKVSIEYEKGVLSEIRAEGIETNLVTVTNPDEGLLLRGIKKIDGTLGYYKADLTNYLGSRSTRFYLKKYDAYCKYDTDYNNHIIGTTKLSMDGDLTACKLTQDININGIVINSDEKVKFYKNGTIGYASSINKKMSNGITCSGQAFLYRSSAIENCDTSGGVISVLGQNYPYAGTVSFYENGVIKSLVLSGKVKIKSQKGKTIKKIEKGEKVTFDNGGSLKK